MSLVAGQGEKAVLTPIANTLGIESDATRAFLEHVVREGFLKSAQRALLLIERDPQALLSALACFDPPAIPRVLDPGSS